MTNQPAHASPWSIVSPRARRTIILVFAVLYMCGASAIYVWSVFIPSLKLEFGWDDSQTSLVFTVCMMVHNFGNFFAGNLHERLGRKRMMLAAALFEATGLTIASLATSHAQMMIGFGLVYATGSGIMFNSMLTEVVRWFPNRPGQCSGTLLLGIGMGSMVNGLLVQAVIDASSWRMGFRLLAALVGSAAVAVTIAFRRPTSEELAALPQPERASDELDTEERRSLTPAEMLHTSTFWVFNLGGVLLSAGTLAITGNAVPVALELGIPQETAALAAGTIQIANGLSRLGMGALVDKAGLKRAMYLDGILFVVAFALLILAARTGAGVLVIVSFIVVGVAYGAIVTEVSMFVLEAFGPRYYASNLGTDALIGSITSPVSQLLGGSLAVVLGSFVATFPVLLLTAALGLAGTVYLFRKPLPSSRQA